MSSHLDVEVAERHGRPVVRKRATDEHGARRLEREVQRLQIAQHPGVVELLEHEPTVVTLAWAGDRSLETYRPGLAAAVALLVALAETVADVHDLGIVHGRLTADHVVIDADGRPRLCGLAGVDPDHDQPTVEDDVAALGRLIDQLIGPGAEAEPIPERRWSRRRWTGYQRRSLQTLADQATDPDPAHRPSARTLAAALATVVPDARLVGPMIGAAPEETPVVSPEDPVEAAPTPPDPVDPEGGDLDEPFVAVDTFLGMRIGADDLHGDRAVEEPRPRSIEPARRRRSGVWIGAAVVLLAVAAVVVTRPAPPTRMEARSLPSPANPTPGEPRDEEASATSPTTAALPTTAAAVTARPVTGCPPVSPPSADIDGDGCPETIAVHGSTIQAGAVRYRLGADGDDVAVGDWDCDGQATPALVRPSTGEVFVFPRWATGAEPLSLTPTAMVPVGAVSLPVEVCGPLQVRSTTGAVTTVAAPGS